MARYRAIRQGFDGKVVREPGEEFDFDGEKGSWMEAIDDEPADVEREPSVKGPRRTKATD